MKVSFWKYHGTGNDFVIINQLMNEYELDAEQIKAICQRRFGVGADGLMYIRKSNNYDFQMVYYNADGNESTMCGNGGRCISHMYMEFMGKSSGEEIKFEAIDGVHMSKMISNKVISLQMSDVKLQSTFGADYILDTGSPHYVTIVENVDDIDVQKAGALIRYSKEFAKNGINVNFMELQENAIKVRTYERGVEAETYSCGTGVTACALISAIQNGRRLHSPVSILTKGGELEVSFESSEEGYHNVWLTGPATKVFEGVLNI